MNEYYYIYNIYQARFFIEQGCKVNSVGLGREGKVWIQFEKTEQVNKAMDAWRTRKSN